MLMQGQSWVDNNYPIGLFTLYTELENGQTILKKLKTAKAINLSRQPYQNISQRSFKQPPTYNTPLVSIITKQKGLKKLQIKSTNHRPKINNNTSIKPVSIGFIDNSATRSKIIRFSELKQANHKRSNTQVLQSNNHSTIHKLYSYRINIQLSHNNIKSKATPTKLPSISLKQHWKQNKLPLFLVRSRRNQYQSFQKISKKKKNSISLNQSQMSVNKIHPLQSTTMFNRSLQQIEIKQLAVKNENDTINAQQN